jgi:hypothetical protein
MGQQVFANPEFEFDNCSQYDDEHEYGPMACDRTVVLHRINGCGRDERFGKKIGSYPIPPLKLSYRTPSELCCATLGTNEIQRQIQ